MGRSRRPHVRSFERIRPHAAGIDIGAREHWIAVDPAAGEPSVRCFGTVTEDLHAAADWLSACGVQTVAMESTGVYWIPMHDVLVDRGFEVLLVDARATKQVAGRKSDVSDCQWIQQLHAYGLLKGAFIPDAQICTLRALIRQRERWVEDAARAIQHMQQALELMNVKLTAVLSDIAGETGQRIIDAIVAGERRPRRLAKLRNRRCRSSEKDIARALQGTWRAEHLFALQQAQEHYRFLRDRIAACDQEIAAVLERLTVAARDQDPPTPPKRSTGKNDYGFDAHAACYRLAGVDLTTIDGMNASLALPILAEIGTDMSPWPSERHFGSWLGLSPHPRKSGGRLLSARTRPNAHRVARLLRMAAMVLLRSQSALGAFVRRLRARLGPAKAITAAAYKLARIIYRMLKTKQAYHDVGEDTYDQRFHQRRLKSISRSAERLGYRLVPVAA